MTNRAEILEESIGKLPREQLANLPTPLQEAPRLSRALDRPRILFKSDVEANGIVVETNGERPIG